MPVLATKRSDLLPGAWLAARWAVDPARVDAMRRDGELISYRDQGAQEWQYPAWQFERWTPRPGVARVVGAARESGLDEDALYRRLTEPLGLGGSDRVRLADLLVEGRVDDVVAAIRRTER
jgi:hypothetical protein